MNDTPDGTLPAVAHALGAGLPFLLLQFALTLLLLFIGVRIYMAVTPYNERALMLQGNVAGGVVFTGAVLGLAIPLASLLATSFALLDIVVWGVVALLLQLLTYLAMSRLIRGLPGMIEAGNVAMALGLAAAQIAVALLNAAAMVPT